METKIVDASAMDLCAERLLNQEVICFPTDTVYGVAACVDTKINYDRLVEAKMRPDSKPFSIMTSSIEQIETIALLTPRDRAMIAKWMPGGVTFIFKKQPHLESYVTNGFDTIGIRMPDDPWILALIDRVNKPLFVPSANISQQPTATTFEEALLQMDGRVSLIVKGTCKGGVASTIVDCSSDELKLIRAGAVSFDAILESVEGKK